MQREVEGGIIITCDFCGMDWDQEKPMVEGHRGAVMCLDCVKVALSAMADSPDGFTCTLCLSSREPGEPLWKPTPVATGNPKAVACGSCIDQTAEAFGKDRSVDFTYDG